jgi:hypothetical protein
VSNRFLHHKALSTIRGLQRNLCGIYGQLTRLISCHRLTKDCQPASFVRKRGVKKPAEARKSQLEDKLDSLVSLLQAQNAANPKPATAPAATTTESSTQQGHSFHSARHPQPLPYTDEPSTSTPMSNQEPSQLRSVRSPRVQNALKFCDIAASSSSHWVLTSL